MAQEILKENGRIYGAAFDQNAMVYHIGIENEQDLEKLRGSKYVQSNLGHIFLKIKDDLKEQKKVLFSGTPCQAAGLRAFLQKDYENLYCVDLVCHGTPSPKVWEYYLQAVEKRMEGKRDTQKVPAFRDKRFGWTEFSLCIPLEGGSEYCETFHQDLYMKTFLQNISLRPSCYQCSLKGLSYWSDITLADFWGIQEVKPELFDGKGTSLLLVNSSKGQKLLESVLPQIKLYKTDYQEAVRYNPAAVRSVKKPAVRKKFFAGLDSRNIEHRMAKLTRKSWKQMLYSFLRKQHHKIRK